MRGRETDRQRQSHGQKEIRKQGVSYDPHYWDQSVGQPPTPMGTIAVRVGVVSFINDTPSS